MSLETCHQKQQRKYLKIIVKKCLRYSTRVFMKFLFYVLHIGIYDCFEKKKNESINYFSHFKILIGLDYGWITESQNMIILQQAQQILLC